MAPFSAAAGSCFKLKSSKNPNPHIEGLEPKGRKCDVSDFTGEPKQILIKLEPAAVAMY